MEFVGKKYTILTGKVLEVRPGTGTAEGRVTNVKLSVDTYSAAGPEKKEIDVAFWKNENSDMASRALVIKKDSIVMIKCSVRDGKYTGWEFGFAGSQMDIEVESNDDNNIRTITLAYINSKKNGDKTSFSVNVKKWDSEARENKDIRMYVNFSSSKKANAEKVLSGEGIVAALVSFPPQTNVNNEQEITSFVAFQFERLK